MTYSQAFLLRKLFIVVLWTLVLVGLSSIATLVFLAVFVSYPQFSGAQQPHALLQAIVSVNNAFFSFRDSGLWLPIIGLCAIVAAAGVWAQVLPGSDNAQIEEIIKKNISYVFMEPSDCKNCGTTVPDLYCPHCGQERVEAELLSFSHFTARTIPEIANVDRKFFRTMYELLTKPGFLTLEYIRGRRARHSFPAQIYFVCAALFFIVGTNLDFNVDVIIDRVPTFAAKVEQRAKQNNLTKKIIYEDINSQIENYIPIYTFIMVFAFAGILKLLFMKEEFVKHIIFSLHFIATFLLCWMVIILFSIPIPLLQKIDFIVILPSIFYLVYALRNVHPGSEIWKYSLAVVSFVVLFFIYTTFGILLSVILL